MKVLNNILSDSKEYYIEAEKKIKAKLSKLPKGSVKERKISGRKYYYLQYRENAKVVHKYISKSKPENLIKQIKQRRAFQKELKQVKEALKVVNRAVGRKR